MVQPRAAVLYRHGAGSLWAPGDVPSFAFPSPACLYYSRDRVRPWVATLVVAAAAPAACTALPALAVWQRTWRDKTGAQGQQVLLSPILLYSSEVRLKRWVNRKVSGNLTSCKELRKVPMMRDNSVKSCCYSLSTCIEVLLCIHEL